MRRRDREIVDRREIEAILRRARICHLGLCDGGRPYVAPVAFGWEDGRLYFHGAAEGRKAAALAADPRVCFEVETDVRLLTDAAACRWTFAYRSVIGEGKAVRLDEPADRRRGLDAIMRHYSGHGWDYPAAVLAATVVWRVDVDSLTGKEARGKDVDPAELEPAPPAADGEVAIRRPTDADADALLDFAATLFAEELPTLPRMTTPTREEELEFIRSHAQDPRGLLLAAFRGDRVVGLLNFRAHARPEHAHAGEFGISVARDWRGRGLGRRLLRGLTDWAPGAGLRRLELRVFANNPDAVRLYESLGWEHEGRQRAAAIIDGDPVDVLLMARLVGD